jgi:phenylacetate-CoA ligase
LEFIENGEKVGAGESGEILVTNLDANAMPLIRYEIGDCGVPIDDECPCGRGLPLMKNIEGRRDDFLILPDGRLVSPRRTSTSVWAVLGVDQYRIIQKKKDLAVIELVKGQGFSEHTITQASDGLRAVLGPDVQVRVDVVDNIPTGKTGKMRKVISEVAH